MAPDPILEDTRWPSAELLQLLQAHVPRSLSLLRRLQFTAAVPGGSTDQTRVLFAHTGRAPRDGGQFAAAYVDVSRGPETEVWLYASAEAALPADPTAAATDTTAEDTTAEDTTTPEDDDVCHALAMAVLRRAKRHARDYQAAGGALFRAHGFLVGALAEPLRALLLRRRAVSTSYWNPTDKYLLRVEALPARGAGDAVLDAGMRWDVVRREDLALVISRTNIPKIADTLMLLPSVAVRLEDGTLAAWAFLALDGTLSTLHCEEPYRRRGIGGAVATRVLRDYGSRFEGGDGWYAADVTVGNVQSQALCESLGGKLAWNMSWTVVDFDSLGEPI